MDRSYEEKISNIDLEIEQLKNRKREITQRHKAEERKARTKRLIERGAILESLIPSSDTLSNDDVIGYFWGPCLHSLLYTLNHYLYL